MRALELARHRAAPERQPTLAELDPAEDEAFYSVADPALFAIYERVCLDLLFKSKASVYYVSYGIRGVH